MVYPYGSAAPYLDGRYGAYLQNNSYYPQSAAERQETRMVCRPVASVEEAKAIPTDFNGNLMILPDFSHGMIHTKQLNYQDGSAIFQTYSLTPVMEETNPPATFAPLDLVEALQAEIRELKEQIQRTGQEKAKPAQRGGSEKA